MTRARSREAILVVQASGQEDRAGAEDTAFDFAIEERSALALIGPNGSGKSQILQLLFGLAERRPRGTILWRGRDATMFTIQDWVRAGVAFVPQRDAVFRDLTVKENLVVGFYPSRQRRGGIDGAIASILEMLPPLSTMLNRFAGTLSGGEARLVALGRALMSEPKLLVLDELSTGLSPHVTLHVAELLKEYVTNHDRAILMAEQSFTLCSGLRPDIVVIHQRSPVLRMAASEWQEEHLAHVQEEYFGGKF